MKKITLILALVVSASGCTTYEGPGSSTGWNDLNPPQSNALGRSIPDSRGARILGSPVVNIFPESVILEDGPAEYDIKNYSQFRTDLELEIAKISGKLGYEYQGSTNSISRRLKIARITSIEDVNEINKKFVYQCLVAGTYEFSARKKNSTQASIDASKAMAEPWANALGLNTAKVEISSKPQDSDSITVKVDSPNICLNYVSAEFKEKRRFFGLSSPKTKNIHGKDGNPTFNLRPGTYSDYRTADIPGLTQGHTPVFRLKHAKANEELQLCINDKTKINSIEKCEPLIKGDDGVWTGPQPAGKYWANNNDLSVVRLNLDTEIAEDGSIRVINPRLNVEQYTLEYR